MTVRPLSQTNDPHHPALVGRAGPARPQSSSASAMPLKLALACLLARGHLLIEDIPGVGKSTLAQALATTLGLKYARVQFTSDLLPADVLGVSIFDTEHAQSFRFHPGPIFHSVVLADEINRAPPKTQSALMEAMEERQVSQDGETRRLPDPFFVIATQNPVEQIGAYPLPESQLDRFLMAIEIGYPDPAAERELLTGGDRRAQIADAFRRSPIRRRFSNGSAKRGAVHVAPALLDYVQALLGRHARQRRQRRRRRRAAGPVASRRLCCCSPRRAPGRCCPDARWRFPKTSRRCFRSVAGHRLAGGARAGALQAQALACAPSRFPDRQRGRGVARASDAAIRSVDGDPADARIDDRHRSGRSAGSLRETYRQRLFRHAPADRDPVTLRHRRIYILPTKRGDRVPRHPRDDARSRRSTTRCRWASQRRSCWRGSSPHR